MSRPRILVVDDEPNIRRMLAGVLADEGYAVDAAADAEEAWTALAERPADLMLLDVKLPGEDGLGLLRRLREAEVALPVIMMSGHGTIRTALEATRLGALDFIEKPIVPERLLLSLANALRLRRLENENAGLREALAATGELIGASPAMDRLRGEIARSAPSEARVLITGENGTGKELVARALHAGSPRRERPFVKVNCAAIPSDLLESELFGHEKGAFTGALSRRRGKFERAQGGTLLLDEIGDMNGATQAKLLRVLEEGEMERLGGERSLRLDVRVLASTNRNLEALLSSGSFRRDLYHRLKVIPIHVPPLREHPEDVEPLAVHYLGRFCDANGRPLKRLDPGALARLRAWPWPGNVRELKNLMERVVIMVDGREVGAPAIAGLLGPAPAVGTAGGAPSDSAAANAAPGTGGAAAGEDDAAGGSLAGRLAACERRLVAEALDAAGGNVAEAARRLGLDRANLHRRLRRLGLRDRGVSR
ncbi:MAG: sigma-54-dependent Fis family transcriptional regulator [Candidatus Krumholzibacteriota bacterium]|nr:sigma-54-dependent Fis family transcriptional regulator [Candidatus Krumholzibacteriota bacterium]